MLGVEGEAGDCVRAVDRDVTGCIFGLNPDLVAAGSGKESGVGIAPGAGENGDALGAELTAGVEDGQTHCDRIGIAEVAGQGECLGLIAEGQDVGGYQVLK